MQQHPRSAGSGHLPGAMPGATPGGTSLPCLLMLPGTLCDGRVFARQARALRGKAHVLRPDFRSLRDRDAWLRALLRRLPPHFSIAGFSLGGLLALELLRIAPERIERLALIASNAEPASRKGARKGRANWRLQRDPRQGAGAVVARAMPLYFHARLQQRQYAGTVRDMARHTPRAAARVQYAWAGQRPSGHAALQRFTGPLLIASGTHDPLCPPAWQRALLRSRPDATWHAFARCGHFVPFEAAARLNDALRRWIVQPVATPSSPPTQANAVP